MKTWKPVIGYEGIYEVSRSGSVRRLAGKNCKKTRILKHVYDTHGYVQVSLCKNGIPKLMRVHILVMRNFVGPPPPGHQINHKDGIKSNPQLNNLEYGTAQWNAHHLRHVLKNKAGIFKGEENKAHKLSNAEVLRIRRMTHAGIQQITIAKQFRVCRDTIRKATQRIYWRHI